MSIDYMNFLKTRKYHNNSLLSHLMDDNIVNNTSNPYLMTYNSNRYQNIDKFFLNKFSFEITKNLINNTNEDTERYNSINSIVFEPIEKSLIFGTSNGSILSYDTCNVNKLSNPNRITCIYNPIKCLLYSQSITNYSSYFEFENTNNRFSNNILLIGDSRGQLLILYDKLQKRDYFNLHSQSITDMSFSLNENIIASSSDDKTVKIFDLSVMKEINSYNEHTSDVKTVDWAKPKSIIATSGKDKKIKFFDCRSKDSFYSMNDSHKNIINKVRFNSDCNYLLTASKDHNVKLIDMRMMKKPIQKFDHHTKGVNSISWNPSNANSFCSIGEDKKIVHWFVDSEKYCNIDDAHNEEIFSLCYNPNGSSLYTGSKFSSIKCWVN